MDVSYIEDISDYLNGFSMQYEFSLKLFKKMKMKTYIFS